MESEQMKNTCESLFVPVQKAMSDMTTKPAFPRMSESTLKQFLLFVKSVYLPSLTWTFTERTHCDSRPMFLIYTFRDEWHDKELGVIDWTLREDRWQERDEFHYHVFKYVMSILFQLKDKFKEIKRF